ncbi:hypothetical protein KY290_033453 [Solanum tuberosum]|uniref:Uncharacterized protein n=1 Tax=Solanum tuberosum TaxID=4113 RepID=A0ABQ7U0L4_SOLTU|nr:hypothetical protein KY289_032807 [Solanum tuberosum]KAH0649574.1 hypothetical protein KY285_034822 [Solanum tuberosum]KAH0740410.1 hypothetical protein KY290_033453 [Solanum tuberosum]
MGAAPKIIKDLTFRCAPVLDIHTDSTRWPDGDAERYCSNDNLRNEDDYAIQMFGSDEELSSQIPTQAQTLVEGSGSVLVSEYKPVPDVDYLQELLAIQQQGPRNIGFFGTRNMGFMHQELIEILSYALVITKNHIFTSGAAGTNAAVIRGALRAEKPELLTVILPQSLEKQPPESQELLSKVQTGTAKISWNRPVAPSTIRPTTSFTIFVHQCHTYEPVLVEAYIGHGQTASCCILAFYPLCVC